jgi:hypothetical protein
LSGPKLSRCPLSGFGRGFEFVLELFFANFGEELAHGGAGLHSHGDEVVASDERWANFGLSFEFFGLFNEVVVNVQAAMGAEAIEAMELEFERKSGAHEQTAEGGFAHLQRIFELHMAADGGDDVVDLFARETEAFENLLGHIRADAFVFVKMDAAGVGIARGGEGFGDIMKEDGPGEGRVCVGGQILEHEEEVVEDRSFGMKIGGLIAGDGGGDFGEDLFEQAALAKEIEAAGGMRRTEEFDEFVADAFGADGMNFGRGSFERGECFGFDIEIELGGESDGAKEAEMIFAEAFGGRTDGADDFCAQIGFAADPIMQFAFDGIEEEAVDCKIATACVGDGVAKNDIGWVASILIIGFGAKGGDLELVIVFENNDDAEFAADRNGAWEKVLDLIGKSGGDDVVIARFAPEEKVANAATNPIGGEAGLLEALDDLSGGFGERLQRRRKRVYRPAGLDQRIRAMENNRQMFGLVDFTRCHALIATSARITGFSASCREKETDKS